MAIMPDAPSSVPIRRPVSALLQRIVVGEAMQHGRFRTSR